MQDRTKRLSRLGNAVVPDCALWVASRLKETAGPKNEVRREDALRSRASFLP
jgi:hypothetical protein